MIYTDTAPVTKFQAPSETPALIARPRVAELLGETIRRHPITLVAAPAGYGKSTLLATCCRNEGSAPYAWLSIDEEDNDPFRFIASLAAAVRHAFGDEAPVIEAGSTIPEPQSLPFAIRQTMSAWINAVIVRIRTPFTLVLDDLHRITEAPVFIALEYLLDHLPPQIRIILSTRYDPPIATARYRAHGMLGEIRAKDLRFDAGEVRAFCRRELGESISEQQLRMLDGRLDGWPAGLRLLTYSLRLVERTDREAFLEGLVRSESYLFDFLAEEVFNRQEQEIRTFLMETSVLTVLTPDLCRAVTGRNDARALMEEISRRNLLIPIHSPLPSTTNPGSDDMTGTAYRYHDLVARFLRDRLEREHPASIRALHRKAAATETDLSRRMRHLLSAEMWHEAAEMIESNAEKLLAEGLFDTVRRWIKSIPASHTSERPRLIMYLGLADMLQGDVQRVGARLSEAARIAQQQGDHTTAARARAHEASVAIVDENPDSSARIIENALEGPLTEAARVQLLAGLSRIYLLKGEWSQAMLRLEEAVTRVASEEIPAVIEAFATQLHPSFITLPGGIRLLDRAAGILHRAARETDRPVLKLAAAAQQAFVRLWKGEIEKAVSSADDALTLLKRYGTGSPYTLVGIYITALQAHMAIDLGHRTEHLFEDASETIRSMGLSDSVVPALFFLLGKFGWLAGRPELIAEAASRMAAAEKQVTMPSAPFFRSALQGMAYVADGNVEDAASSFRKAMAFEESRRISMVFGSARVLLAYLYHTGNRSEAGLMEFLPLLRQARAERLPGLVMREACLVKPLLSLATEDPDVGRDASRLLESIPTEARAGPVLVPGTAEQLTEREVEVIHWLSTGMRNREMAERLFISERTVKAHVSSIMAKLKASSRTEAAARARELGIVR